MEGKIFRPLGRDGTQGKKDILSEVISLRLPIFNQNKPYLFLKISKNTDKYRLSLSPDFLKQYNLSFRIFRNKSLDNLISELSSTSRLNTNFAKLDFRLPKKESQEIIKLNYLIDLNDDNKDTISIEKYTFLVNGLEETVVFITERNIVNNIPNVPNIPNICLSFVSKRYKSLEEFLKVLDTK